MEYTRRLPEVTFDEAFDYVIDYLRSKKRVEREAFHEGRAYDLYIYDVAHMYIEENTPAPSYGPGMHVTKHEYGQNLGPFMEAAWSLVSSGIVVPGSVAIEERNNGSSFGFTVTGYGREWLDSREVSANPRRYGEFGRLLNEFDIAYGDSYAIRSQEALSCYRHGNYVACCAMVGACAETILLKAYAKKIGNQEKAWHDMAASGGRGRAETSVLGGLKEGQRTELQSSFSLLKYWRDTSAHGLTARTNQSEAYVALLTLLSLAQAVQRYLL